jgi:ATP-binding cassette subfamily B protein
MDSLKIIKPFLLKYKYILIIYTVFILLSYPLETIFIPKLFSELFKSLNGNFNEDILITFFKHFGLLMTITNVSQIICSKIDSYITPRFSEFVTNHVFQKILYYYENNYSDLELGTILTRINSLPSVLREVTTELFNWILPKLFTIIIVNCYFFYYNKNLGIISFIYLILICYYNFYEYKKCIILSNKKYKAWELKTEILQDKLSNLYSIYSSSKVNDEINEFKQISSSFKNDQETTMNCTSKIKNVNTILTFVFFIYMLYYIARLYKNKVADINILTTLYMILIFYIPCLTTLVTYLPDYTNHMGILSSINDYIKTIDKENIQKPDIKITDGKIIINNLNFGYTDKKKIFTNFNLTINANDKLAIMGPSGNGKSTLIKLLMGYYKVDDNVIFIDNQDINKYNLSSLRKQISFVNQNTKLFNKTIYENIKYGNQITKREIDILIKKYNIISIFKNLPKGFKTKVGVNGDSLSGGQKQIIQLLRCYSKKNKILILDEPTSALDLETKKIIIKIIKDISEKSTMIIITHDQSNLDLVKQRIIINDGKIII